MDVVVLQLLTLSSWAQQCSVKWTTILVRVKTSFVGALACQWWMRCYQLLSFLLLMQGITYSSLLRMTSYFIIFLHPIAVQMCKPRGELRGK